MLPSPSPLLDRSKCLGVRLQGKPAAPPLLLKLHRYTGYTIGAIILGRTLLGVPLLSPPLTAARCLRHSRAHDPLQDAGWYLRRTFDASAHPLHRADFELVAASLKYWPYLFYPYYVVFACSGLYHLVYGFSQACSTLFHRSPFRRGGPFFYTLVGAASIGIVSALLAFGGVYFPVHIEKLDAIHATYEKQLPAFLIPWKKKV